MEWSATKQQVFAFESDIVVSAGAGSGKTAALVELYLRLLAGETRFPRELAVEEIVAITFTDKAALEMKERVRSGMAERLARGETRLSGKDISGPSPPHPSPRFTPSAPVSSGKTRPKPGSTRPLPCWTTWPPGASSGERSTR